MRIMHDLNGLSGIVRHQFGAVAPLPLRTRARSEVLNRCLRDWSETDSKGEGAQEVSSERNFMCKAILYSVIIPSRGRSVLSGW